MKLFIVVFAFCIQAALAIIPPAPGVTAPSGFAEMKAVIEKSYSTGYYAEKMLARKLLAEKIASGEIKNALLTADTVFALTLLGKFTDLPNHYSAESLQMQLFDGPNPTGTVTDYYREVSYNQMYFSGKANGWYTVPGTMSSYVGSNNGLGTNGGPKFVYDLIVAADANINYADYIQYYDANNTPHIGFIAAIHTGADAAAGATNIWSHRWSFRVYSGGAYTSNDTDPVSGKKVVIDGDYAIEPELKGSSNSSGGMIDIGVFAHEFGHIFGLPDLYDTDNSSEGLGQWCLMASGSWGGDGSTPQLPTHMSAWCKQKLGWIVPITLDSLNTNILVRPAEFNKDIYKVWKHGVSGSKEYFLIENRQLTGFDIKLMNEGVLIFHVDDNMSGNTNENHYLVGLMQADGRRDLNLKVNRGDAGDPFPGATNNRVFGVNTNPSSNAYSAAPSYVLVRNFVKSGSNYTIDIDNGTIPNIDVKNMGIAETITGNGRVEPGEMGSLLFNASNIGASAYNNYLVSVNFSDPAIIIKRTGIQFGLTSGQSLQMKLDSVFYVPQNYTGHMVWMYYTVNSGAIQIKDSLKLPIGVPDYLLVNKSERGNLTPYYTNSLDSLNGAYEEGGSNGLKYFAQRKAIIIYTGRLKDTLFAQTEIDSLTAYVKNGGNIFFSGQNLAEYLNVSYPEFLHSVIGAQWIKNGGLSYRNAYKVNGDLLGSRFGHLKLSGTDGAANEFLLDVLAPNTDSFHPALSYKTDSVECAGGWRMVNGVGKIFIAGFGFESINNLESDLTRKQALGVVLDWFKNSVTALEQGTKLLGFQLRQNYPNPFNPSTVISFMLPNSMPVKLTVYDALGNEIVKLVNSVLEAGEHKVQFNGSRLASGVYFYHLECGASSINSKMLLLK